MNRGVKIGLIVLASILGVGILGAGGFMAYKTMGRSETIRLDSYTDFDFTGKDGKGKASMEIDRDTMKEDYPRINVDGLLDDCVDGEFDEDEGLSNGDHVTWEWECDDDKAAKRYHVVLEYDDEEVKVKGLKKTEKADIDDKDRDKGNDKDKDKDKDKDDDGGKTKEALIAGSLKDLDREVEEDLKLRSEELLEQHFENDFSVFEYVTDVEYVGMGFELGVSASAYENIVQPVYMVTVIDDMDRNGSFEDKVDSEVVYYTYIDYYNVPCENTTASDVYSLDWSFTTDVYRPNDDFYYWGAGSLEDLIDYMLSTYPEDYEPYILDLSLADSV